MKTPAQQFRDQVENWIYFNYCLCFFLPKKVVVVQRAAAAQFMVQNMPKFPKMSGPVSQKFQQINNFEL